MRFAFPKEIKGWLSFGEGRLLFELAQINPHLGNVVELGCFHGKSTICLAYGSRKVGGGKVYTVDNFIGDRCIGWQDDFYDQFKQNIKRYKFEGDIIAFRGDIMEVARGWSRPIRLLFIDASHFYAEVLEDYQSWEKFVAPGGIIAFHDSEWAGVYKVLCQLIRLGRLKDVETYKGSGSSGLTYGVKVGNKESISWLKRHQSWLKFKFLFLSGFWPRFKQSINQREERDFWFQFFGRLASVKRRICGQQ